MGRQCVPWTAASLTDAATVARHKREVHLAQRHSTYDLPYVLFVCLFVRTAHTVGVASQLNSRTRGRTDHKRSFFEDHNPSSLS